MIRNLAFTKKGTIRRNLPLEHLEDEEIAWYWVDFHTPDEGESSLLDSHFHFHPLAIEDCLHLLQRPKLEHYGDTHFFVVHALTDDIDEAEEVNLFLTERFLVTYHRAGVPELEEAWKKVAAEQGLAEKGPLLAAYTVIDKLVDGYFPRVYELEDRLDEMESNVTNKTIETLMNEVFAVRSSLLKLRRTIVPMRDLLYRIINSQRIRSLETHLYYFTDIYDHLLKLTEMVESNREMTAELRDSYLSLNSNRMNTIMKTLTVITTVFMPLSFLAGVYGMNFAYMPELQWKGGYYAVLGIMAVLGGGMIIWFLRKGWFR
ncbi:putative metal ion transporter YfjQ [Paenibacillus sp. J31TS4]|uniref:magnesium/cobalt transporter CorA n=1 Tax=Paenibacillus sp. J31TS4 TaxID=2807195 RepID=UPI001B0285E4|nr:magnesium/cobalt transporter CorA [Paenibacillus sp. J31TS4]GIP40921.1 putative metal ion transporter YfjQ [Paenibacillus sp. J31TS4]